MRWGIKLICVDNRSCPPDWEMTLRGRETWCDGNRTYADINAAYKQMSGVRDTAIYLYRVEEYP